MVKVDYKRNYYADLEVSPQAKLDDIKKQFRKLGKLFPMSVSAILSLVEDKADKLIMCSPKVPSRQKPG